MKKGKWSLVIEYFLAGPILGFPCYATIPVWAGKNGIFIVGVIIVAFLFGFLALYQLKRVSIVGSGNDLNLFLSLGIICTIISLFFLLHLFQTIPSPTITNQSTGTGDSTIISGVATIISSFGFGFLLGFSILFLGYAWLEYKISKRGDLPDRPYNKA